MQTTENQRLKVLMNKLGFGTQLEFARVLRIKQGSLSDILREKEGVRVSDSIKYKLETLYNVNPKWIETGDGDMFLDERGKDTKVAVGEDINKTIPSYGADATAIREARLSKRLSMLELGKLVGVSHQMISQYEKGAKPSSDVYDKLNQVLELNRFAVENVNPNVRPFASEAVPLNFLDSDNKFPNTQFTDIGAGRYLMVMPKVTEYAHAGYLAGYSDPEYLSELPKHSIIVDKYHFGQYRAFVGVGDSMDDGTIESIPHGSIITGRLINQILYQRDRLHLHRYKDFVIVHKEDGILVKRIIEHNVKDGTIICHSLNPDKDTYPDFKLNLQDVAEIYNVIDVNIKR